jgi:prefoldin subunit 5
MRIRSPLSHSSRALLSSSSSLSPPSAAFSVAVSPDPTRLFLDVGLGFHVELTIPEALAFIDAKLPSLDAQIATKKQSSAMIQSKMKVVYEGIAELMQLQEQQQPKRHFF